MTLGIMQPYFFPYLGYFQLIHAADQFLLYDNLKYSRRGWVNRNRILVVGGSPMFLSVSIKEPRATKTIRSVELLGWRHRREKLLRSIHANYRRCPHFREANKLIEEILFLDTESLAELNKHCVVTISRFLGIDTAILTNSTPFDAMEDRLRDDDVGLEESFPRVRLEEPQRRVVRALELCRELGADVFVNAIGGRELYAKAAFAAHGVQVLFVRTRPHTYRQRAIPFSARLSIIDTLMNTGRDRTRKQLDEYDLI